MYIPLSMTEEKGLFLPVFLIDHRIVTVMLLGYTAIVLDPEKDCVLESVNMKMAVYS